MEVKLMKASIYLFFEEFAFKVRTVNQIVVAFMRMLSIKGVEGSFNHSGPKRLLSLIRHTSRSISLRADHQTSDLLPLKSGGLGRRWARTVANISIGVVSVSGGAIPILSKGHQIPSSTTTTGARSSCSSE